MTAVRRLRTTRIFGVMPANVLVIVIDGLRASALGAYGNTSFATPALDRFAAESMLMDWCYAPSADLPDIYRALWHSQQSSRPRDTTSREAGDRPSTLLSKVFAGADYSTTLVTDEPSLSSFTAAADFDEIVQVAGSTLTDSIGKHADDSSGTNLARAFAAVVDQASGVARDKSHLIWFHARGMYGPWDAPRELQQSLLDDDDPPPVESTTPPELFVSPNSDPDAAFRYACAYAAQVMVLDECLESLLDATNAFAGDEWLILFMGARGFPLGEHAQIGGADPRTHAEQLHVPWLVRYPDHRGQLARVAALTSHIDVLPTLFDWIDRDRSVDRPAFDGMSILPFASAAHVPWRDAMISTSATARSIRSTAWCLREDVAREDGTLSSNEATVRPELYVRPDDRWEANDVAKLCPDVVDELRAAISAAL
jgi:arylsulfatase A-like enzyme